MSFSAIVERHFRSILSKSAFVGLAAVILFGCLWIFQARDHTKTFVMSQVRAIVVANVNSQNLAAIDGELNRVIGSWSSTEMFPVRVDVELNGRLWAHAGQLHHFGWASFNDNYSETLSSGDRMLINVQTDVGSPLAKLGFAMSALAVLFAITFWRLYRRIKVSAREITNPLSLRVKQIEKIAANLTEPSKLVLEVEATTVDELNALDHSLRQLTNRIMSLEGDLAEVHFHKGQVKAAEYLAHSLKGIVANFQLTLTSESLSSHDREGLSSNLRQLIAISEDVLKARKSLSVPNRSLKEDSTFVHVGDVVSRLIDLRQIESAAKSNGRIQFEFVDLSNKAPTVMGAQGLFEGAVGNIISNAYEAIGGVGKVVARLRTFEKSLRLEIEDDGHGIPENILEQLGQEGITSKQDGNGLGLFHTKSTIERMGGSVHISSAPGNGTSVSLELPLAMDLSEKRIVIFPGQTLVVIDDDPAIHDFFRRKLGPLKSKIQIVDLFSPEEFKEWYSRHLDAAPGARQYIFDYEFVGSNTTGLDLVEAYELTFESIVISGIADKDSVVAHAKRIKTQLMSKDRLSQIQIKWEGIDEESILETVN